MRDDQEPSSSYAVLVRQIRLMKGLSQEEVARRAGLGRSHLGMLESGKRGFHPARDTVLQVAKGLDATSAEREALLEAAGFPVTVHVTPGVTRPGFVQFVQSDPELTDHDKRVLIATYLALKNGDPASGS